MKAERAGEQRVWGPLQIPMMVLVTCETSLMLFSLVISRSRTPASVCVCGGVCVCVCVSVFSQPVVPGSLMNNLWCTAENYIFRITDEFTRGWGVMGGSKKNERKRRGRPDHPPVCVFWYVYVTALISPDFSSFFFLTSALEPSAWFLKWKGL